jgi:hypothetical protein
MQWRARGSVLWQHIVRSLVLFGVGCGGSMQCYLEYTKACPLERWDWSVPARWHDQWSARVTGPD